MNMEVTSFFRIEPPRDHIKIIHTFRERGITQRAVFYNTLENLKKQKLLKKFGMDFFFRSTQ